MTEAPLFPLRRLVLAGVLCIFMAAALTAGFLRIPLRAENTTSVIRVETSAAGLSVSTFQTGRERGAVIWLEGMPFIPDGERLP